MKFRLRFIVIFDSRLSIQEQTNGKYKKDR